MIKQIVGTVSGVISGGIVMALTTGVVRFFAEGTEASVTWITLSLVLSLGAAVLGGWTAALVGHKSPAVPVLAGMVLVFGLLSAAGGQQSPDPRWITFVTPVLGAAGVLIGGRRRLGF